MWRALSYAWALALHVSTCSGLLNSYLKSGLPPTEVVPRGGGEHGIRLISREELRGAVDELYRY
jgi:hypothetical protein